MPEANLKLVGAVAIKLRPDARGFRGETQREIKKQLAGFKADVKVEAKVDLDTKSAELQAEQFEKKASGKKISMRVGLDYDSVRAAQQRFEKMLEPTKRIKFDLKDEGSIEKARAKLAKLAEKAKVKITYAQDDAGYQSVLDRIAEVRRQKLEKTIRFKTDDASLDILEAEMRRKMSKAAAVPVKQTITISYDNNRAALEAAIAKIDAELKKVKSVEVDVELDPEKLKAARKFLEDQLANQPLIVEFTPDVEGYQSVLKKIREIQRQRMEIPVDLNLNDEELNKKRYEIERTLREMTSTPVDFKVRLDEESQRLAEREAKELKEKIDAMTAEMEINLSGAALVAAQLAFLGRDRIVTYFAKVNARSVAVAEGTLKSLAGLNVLHSATEMLEKLFTKFDSISLKVSAVTTLLGGLADAALYAFSSMVKVGEGVLQSVGLLALGPTVLGSLFTTLLIGQSVFKDFGAAAHGIEAAMKRLPPAGQAAAKIFQKVFAEVRQGVSKEFWGEASDAMLRFSETALPAFTRGLSNVAGRLGKVFGGILDSFTNLAAAGQLDRMFDNLVAMFENMSAGATDFWDALNIIGLRGSEFLPQFGDWLTKISAEFRNWSQAASDSGDLDRYIKQGVSSLKEMFLIGGATVDIFKALANAAGKAGTGGLAIFRQNLEDTAREWNSAPWQQKAANIFSGARAGASALNEGFKALKGSIGDSSAEFGNMLRLLGEVGGGVLSNLGVIFGSQNFQTGATRSLDGLVQMMTNLHPAASSLANIIGNLNTIAGVAFSNLGHLISRMFALVDDAFSRVVDGLAALTPRLINTVGALFLAAAPAAIALAEAIAAVLDVINQLPAGFVLAGVAMTTFFALRALASKFFGSLAGTQYFKNLKGEWIAQQVAAGNTKVAYRQVGDQLKKTMVPSTQLSATRLIFNDLTSRAGETTRSIRDMYTLARQGQSAWQPFTSALRNVRTEMSGMGTAMAAPLVAFRSAMTASLIPMRTAMAQAAASINPLRAAIAAGVSSMQVLRLSMTLSAAAGAGPFRLALMGAAGAIRPFRAAVAAGVASSAAMQTALTNARTAFGVFRASVSLANATMGPFRTALGLGSVALAPLRAALTVATTAATPFRTAMGLASAGVGVLRTSMGLFGATGTAFKAGLAASSGALGAFRVALGLTAAAFNPFKAAMGLATTAMVPFRAAMLVTSAVVGATARAIGTGLLGVLGGPWGVAFAAAAIGVAVFAQNQADAKAKVEAFTATLDAQTGAITARTGALVAANIVDNNHNGLGDFSGIKSASEVLQIFNASIEETGQIIAAGGPAYDQLIKNLDEGIDAFTALNYLVDENNNYLPGNAKALDAYYKKFNLVKGSLTKKDLIAQKEFFEGQRAIIEAQQNSVFLRFDAAPDAARVRDFNAAMNTYNDVTATADSRTRALKAAIELLNGKNLNLDDATLAVNDSMRAAEGTMENVEGVMKRVNSLYHDAKGELRDYAGVIDAVTGEINTQGEVGANFYKSLKGTTEDVLTAATRMKDAKKPISEITKYLADQRQRFVDNGVAAGHSAEIIGKAYDYMIGANPKQLETLITAVGVDEANAKLREYKGTLEEMDGFKAVAQIAGDNTVLGVALAEGYTNLSKWDQAVGTATAGLDPAQANLVRIQLEEDLLALATSDPTVRALMDPAILDRILERTVQDVKDLGDMKPTPEVRAETEVARQKIATIRSMLDNLTNKDVTVTVTRVDKYRDEALARRDPNASANGSIQDRFGRALAGFAPKYFANGGIERHVAQIQKAGGPVRIWAEPETFAEAYIPYAQSKRPRSVAILAQVAKDFGYSLNRNAEQFSNGGTYGSTASAVPTRTSSTSVTVGTINTVDPESAVRKLRALQQDALAVAGIY